MTVKKRIYLDYAATTPLCHEAEIEMSDCASRVFGNPSGIYASARKAREQLEKARTRIAGILHVYPDEIYFTSGGTESDNWALKGIAFASRSPCHVITTMIEHPAVLNTCHFLEKLGHTVTYIRPGSDGRIDPQAIQKEIQPETVLISVMWANNEIGTVEPVAEIAEIAREHNILFHTDAVQAAGVLPIRLDDKPIDLLSASAHKFYGPKGIGILYLRRGTKIEALIHGGEQERGLRASTENVIGAVGMAAALQAADDQREHECARLEQLRNDLINKLTSEMPDLIVNGSMLHRLPGNLHLSVPSVKDESLIPLLDLNGIEASAGSACMAGSYQKSHVLKAIGTPNELLNGSLRLSLGRDTSDEDISTAAQQIITVIRTIRGE